MISNNEKERNQKIQGFICVEEFLFVLLSYVIFFFFFFYGHIAGCFVSFVSSLHSSCLFIPLP
jgi:hypothetical protein